MAKIRVSHGIFGRDFSQALEQARQGDVLVVSEGEYVVDSVFIADLSIIGVGDPDKIILRGQIEIRGSCKISNLTLEAPPFHNAINLKTKGARVEVTGCQVHGEPTFKYPVIISRGGNVVMKSTQIHAEKTSHGMFLSEGSQLHAEDSGIARTTLVGSRASLRDVNAYTILCRERAVVESQGMLDLRPQQSQRMVVLEGESSFRAAQYRWAGGHAEVYTSASFLQLSQVHAPAEAELLVIKERGGRVDVSSELVRVSDSDIRAEEPKPTEPKVVLWRVQDSKSFSTAVAPHLKKGDTVLLEEGEYFLDDYDGYLTLGANISGKGRAEHTIINGGLGVMESCDISVSNLTLRPSAETNGFNIRNGGSAVLTNVILDPGQEAKFPALYLDSGVATLVDCHVLESGQNFNCGGVTVAEGAQEFSASDSELGWVQAYRGAAVKLSDCSCFQVLAGEDAAVLLSGHHTMRANAVNQRQLVVHPGASLEVGQADYRGEHFEAFVSSGRMQLDDLRIPDEATASVYYSADSSLEVGGAPVEFIDLNSQAEDEDGSSDSFDAVPAAEEPTPQATPQDHAPAGAPEPSDEFPAETSPEDEEGELAESADPLAEIRALTGLATVKDQIQSFTDIVRFNMLRRQGNLKTTDISMHSLFLGNPGTGKTTVARLLGKALYEAGAVDGEHFVEVGRRHLVGETLGASANLTQQVLESARGGVLFIDEAYSLYQKNNNEFAQEAVDTLLTFMENHRDEIVVIFAGYADRMQDFLAMNPGLKSRVPNRFDFEDYAPEEIAAIGYQSLLEDDYSVDEALYCSIVSLKYARSSDRSNGRWVRNFNQELVKEMARRVLSEPNPAPENLTRVTEQDLYQLAGGDSEQKEAAVQQLLDQLEELVGLAPVKEWVRKLVNRVKVDQQRLELDGGTTRPTYHMVFSGNPGTGKTTVGKLISQLFYYLGVLENPTVKVVDRSKLIGRWIGHTEEITSRAIDEAMGGVLFVDEAYQLSVEGSANDFGKQAVETFMTRLEDDRDKFVAIFAGYTEQMERFLATNPGLRSRIPFTIEFPDYSPDEVAQIVVAQLSKRWLFNQCLVSEVAAENYAALPEKERSNGRWARIFAERLEAEQSEHIVSADLSGEVMKHIPDELIRSLRS